VPLRPYQRACLKSALADYRAGIRRQLWVLPCGGGKTEIVSRIPDLLKQQRGEQGMFIVNRDDLVMQAARTFTRNNPNLRVGIEKAEEHADPNSDIVICSLQTIGKVDGVSPRFARFDEERVRWVVVDECHAVLSLQYLHALRHLRLNKAEPNIDHGKLLVGITATPDRSDGVGLEAVFDKITYEISIRELMEDGPVIDGRMYSYLAPVLGYRVTTDFDVSMARTRKGDFLEQDLSNALDNPERNKLILDRYLGYGERMRAIAFTVNVQHAHTLTEMFRAHGIPAVPVSGDTKRAERDRIYAAFEAGDIRMIASCSVLQEGFDAPAASVALMCSPTKSSLRYRQSVGRVLRRFPSVERMTEGGYDGWVKPHAIIIDFCDLLGRHSIQCAPTLFGLKADFDLDGGNALEAAKEVQQVLQRYPSIQDAKSIKELRAQVDSVDIFRAPVVRPDVRRYSKFSWLEILDGVLQLNTKACALEVRVNALGRHEVYQSVNGIRSLKDTVPALQDALRIADALVPKDEWAIHVTRAKWREEAPTEAQCSRLHREDERLRKKWSTPGDFYRFAISQHGAGDVNYSKGALSRMIDRYVLSKAVPA
jgi:superfamily II DNA or RNA helicase